MALHPPHPCVVHPLPPAPHFVGREPELAELRRLWWSGFRGVLALVGLGGAGKTAVAAGFLADLARSADLPRPDGVFVWSFYQEPDAGHFLRELYAYFAPDAAAGPARGTGLLHLLRNALARGGPHLLVLDGLERVQRQTTEGPNVYGEIEDPLLKGLLTRLAEGVGRTTVLITSRFPLPDLDRQRGRGYLPLDVGGLGPAATRALLRAHGVWGDDAALDELAESYGAHALTLDHLGALVGRFLDGDPHRAPEVPALTAPGSDRQALRLARLLRAYEEHLPPAELALLSQLCLLRRSVTEEQIQQLFLCTPVVCLRTVREIEDEIARLLNLKEFVRLDLQLDLASGVRQCLEEALAKGSVAGPASVFRQEVLEAAARVAELWARHIATDTVEPLARRYAQAQLHGPSDELPLSGRDRWALIAHYRRYEELRDHPLSPFKAPAEALEKAFLQEGYGLKPKPPIIADLDPVDVHAGYKRAQRALRYLICKHFALRRVRELCRLYQRKWELAGPLAGLDLKGLRQVLDALIGRHLVLREAAGSFSVHPAVRDHFGRRASAAEAGARHDLLREQLVSLVQRPGKGPPEDPATLDLVEEAIYHAQQAGRPEEALGLYNDVLGGLRHLGWKLGEMARGLRILRGFEPCPDRWALAWYLRALGELEPAYAANGLPYFRADVRLLQGRLPQVAAEGDDARTAVAAFLMGRAQDLPPDLLGCAIPRGQVLLYLGRLDAVRQAAEVERLYRHIGWENDRAHCQLLLAEVARRQADRTASDRHLHAAACWVLHAGSVEHLGLLHLLRARQARDAGDWEAAQQAVSEGLHLTRQCGLGLYHIELLCEQAEICLARADAPAAADAAGAALERATAADCQFRWGAAAAGHLLGQALAAQQRLREAITVLEEASALRVRLGDPKLAETERLLKHVFNS
jgi:hypothetical protein